MRVVAKYGLSPKKEHQIMQLPRNSRILSVVVQHEYIFFYVEQDANTLEWPYSDCEYFKPVEFAVFKDCRSFGVDNYQFLGTVVLDFGNNIYHIFYRDV